MNTQCELCKTARAVMCLYARNPSVQIKEPARNDNPFYPISEADIAINVCVDCFETMSATMREEKYVAIRATGVVPNKAPYNHD